MHLPRFLTVFAALAALIALPALHGAGAAATPQAAVSYVALGDSYSSGAGAGSYQSGSGDCRRSNRAYPQLWSNANSPSSFHFTACSGARTTDVINNQLGPLSSATTLVSVSIGGNDAGFADVMTTCVLQGESACLSRVAVARNYISGTLPGRLDAVYGAIRGKAPAAQVVVLGYPRMYKLGTACVGISERSRAALNEASDALNEVTAKRAADHGFRFGDVRSTFTGHELCSGAAWLHGLTWPVGDSYHPTAAGQSGGYHPVLSRNA
ncbi:SGNH/GDSL hydrolase family protein [Streptomyces sp. 549]|uniref:SGNH/GDSL hydrolase family protein n=1 Tax=Streptomyces sp. 549 TaxID=3049076 RepID=UPI0024C22E15|nr:SGNH/GDSL hydrolase family protein [Streptomyces sp. 549]MDK1474644.1 SGNH/GDSL hydrolase family protein [Streptomyces sp. 549]